MSPRDSSPSLPLQEGDRTRAASREGVSLGREDPHPDGFAVSTSPFQGKEGATERPLLVAEGLTKFYGRRAAVRDVSFEIYEGEVLAVVGESGSGKTTLLKLLAGDVPPTAGQVDYRMRDVHPRALFGLSEGERRHLLRTDWGFVHQDPRDGLRMGVSAGANIGERLMAIGDRHYGNIRGEALAWLDRVEIAADRIDDDPRAFSGGMRQRLQIARNLVTRPRLVFMDEPTGGLDVSVQARLLDLLRRLVADLGLAVILVTHDLGVARLVSHRILVMREGRVVETGLTDQVLDDPREPYSQLLVASILQ
jgi:putative phosphonate transport system ATP-binding protein